MQLHLGTAAILILISGRYQQRVAREWVIGGTPQAKSGFPAILASATISPLSAPISSSGS